jgi:hypothetical protein
MPHVRSQFPYLVRSREQEQKAVEIYGRLENYVCSQWHAVDSGRWFVGPLVMGRGWLPWGKWKVVSAGSG